MTTPSTLNPQPSASIQGLGWVTPLGTDLDDVWNRIRAGERAQISELTNPFSKRSYPCMAIPPKMVESLARNPRLRRSSPISYYAAAAGLAALENAGLKITPEFAERTAIILAVASGGVNYTRKFYDQIVQQGANTASPLLFPETVYNAPASHLAALLGITGMTYTLVGDAAIGLAAIRYAEQLFATTDVEHCVVVGAEEVDWTLSEAYCIWRLSASDLNKNGMILGEGAAAIVLGRSGRIKIESSHDGASFFSRKYARDAIARAVTEVTTEKKPGLIIESANGTFVDGLEGAVLEEKFSGIPRISPKRLLGEAFGASALIQTICGAMALRDGFTEPVLVSTLGLNQHASALLLGRSS